MDNEAGLIQMTRLVKDFALGAVNAQSFIDKYSNFYYYEAFGRPRGFKCNTCGR